MADLTKGYPFAFQVLGYLTWNHHGDYNAVRGEYEQYLSEFVYDKIWSELSQKDRMVARGIADVEGGKIKDIREHLHCRFLKNMLWKIINYLLTGQRI